MPEPDQTRPPIAKGVPSQGLPAEAALPAVRAALQETGLAVLQAPPGAGKTTLVPLALADTDLGAAFARLAPELQAVLAAIAFCGLSTREAARILAIPQGTVKTRLRRARDTMKDMI